MSRVSTDSQRKLRVLRTRAKLKGTAQRPRLSLRISNRAIDAQAIDDSVSKTLASASSKKQDVDGLVKSLSSGLKKAKITDLVLDRGAKKYHGVVATVAEGLRKEGINL